jgi:hypothetical protein
MTITRKQLRNVETNSAYQIKGLNAIFDMLDEDRKEAELKRQLKKREDTDANENKLE